MALDQWGYFMRPMKVMFSIPSRFSYGGGNERLGCKLCTWLAFYYRRERANLAHQRGCAK
ncbi:MAG: hypothetical protein DID90_2727552845 [Candidatus Nitrotoga sp. LAW]|nr:MAG: hypothetical protein DID90_2727552845 [Candidatus Nitrotoga sp. LAW]